jgi:hypothetical protein
MEIGARLALRYMPGRDDSRTKSLYHDASKAIEAQARPLAHRHAALNFHETRLT